MRRLIALALLAAPLAAWGCGERAGAQAAAQAAALTGGDPARAPAIVRRYGCGSCHTIPGVDGANSLVGPPLTGLAARMYIAGVLPNTPANLIRWIQHPQQVDPKTAMPELGVTEEDARDLAAYIYTLR